MEWHADGVERWGLGSPALSVGLPVGTPAGPRDLRGLDFFENMLPEGPALGRMAALARVRPADTYGILTAFGRDCAGAVMLLPDGEQSGEQGRSGYTPMTPGDLRQVISDLDATPLGAAPERGFRPSLPGFQRKALLGRAADGTWQLPYGDAPSTWISSPTARTRWQPTRPPACGSPQRARLTRHRPNSSTYPGCPYSRSGATTGWHPQAEFSRPGCTKRTAARRPRRHPG